MKKKCCIWGCKREHSAKGYCDLHYHRVRNKGTPHTYCDYCGKKLKKLKRRLCDKCVTKQNTKTAKKWKKEYLRKHGVRYQVPCLAMCIHQGKRILKRLYYRDKYRVTNQRLEFLKYVRAYATECEYNELVKYNEELTEKNGEV